jgi:ABC-type sugar transport system ATPase subunit
MSTDLLIAANISKRFGITQALDDVSVSFRAGEVHALMGENGAGKSTLGKAIAGLHRPDTGTVQIAGHTLIPGSIEDAFEHGVRIVHQELAQCPNLSVAENLTLHDLPSSMGFVKRREMVDRAAALVHRLDPGIDVNAPLERLSPGRRQIVQIASALEERSGAGHQVRVIVFDEPTSSLSVAEADRLLEITRELANKGLTIIYVSHRMGEIFQVCDRVTVLRDGKFVATSEIAAIDEPTLVEQMIGRRIETAKRAEFASGNAAGHENLLEVRGLNSGRRLRDISLNVRAGEVVGVGGLVGSGRSELLNAIFGIDPAAKGQISVAGKDVSSMDARGRIRSGLGYVPEDRRLQGLFFELDISQNITMPFMAQLAGALGFRGISAERDLVDRKMKDFKVKAASPASRPGELSGGNQQKLLIARWMGKGTRVLLLDEPTRGIDVGTKAEVYRLVREAAAAGTAVLLVSSEMPELLALSDRVLVMCEGGISGELAGSDLTQASILNLATVSTRARRA